MKVAQFLLSVGYREVDKGKAKISFYKKTLKCDFLNVIEMIKVQPKILDLSEEKILAQLEMLKENLNLQDEQISKLVQRNANFLGISQKYIKQKKDALKQTLSLNNEEVDLFVSKAPDVLLYKDIVINERVKFFQDKLMLSNEQTRTMIINSPSIMRKEVFGQIDKSFKDSIKYVSQIADKEAIIKNAMLLTFPARKLKVRYLILAPIFEKEVILDGNNLIRNERLLWARREYLRREGMDEKLILDGKKTFEGRTGLSDNQLIKEFPFTFQSVDNLEAEYYFKFGKSLILDSSERRDVFAPQTFQKARRNAGIKKHTEQEKD